MNTKFTKYFLLFVIIYFPHIGFANSYTAINYKITPQNSYNLPAIKIEMEIKGDIKDKIILDLPSKWGSADYTNQIKNVRLKFPEGNIKIKKQDKAHQAIIILPKAIDTIIITYEIHQHSKDSSNVHNAIIRNDLVYSPGYGLFATLQNLTMEDKIPITISWQEFPHEWKYISSHGLDKKLSFRAMHNWIGGKISNNELDARLNYWWSEGFTEYYTRVLAARSKSISFQEFLEGINDFLRIYCLSQVINEPNVRINQAFWENDEVKQLPYYRGFVFAIYLNSLIKEKNPRNYLDSIMHDLLKTSKEQGFSKEYFQNIIKDKHYISEDIEQEIEQFINQGRTIKLDSLMPSQLK